MSQLAKTIVKAVLDDLSGRKGFDEFWDDVDSSIRREIRSDLHDVVQEKLDLAMIAANIQDPRP
jgi:hypothetical protein